MREPTTAIRLDHVEKRYPGATALAVADLTLEVPEGELVALVGPAGCGKTTTLRMVNRLEEPTAGRVEVGGRDVRTVPAHELRRGIGYVIQQTGLFPHRTIAANIATVPHLLGWDRERVEARVAELVALLGLDPDLLGRYPAALSGGQQQRVGVARALAADPPVLLMDEPYTPSDAVDTNAFVVTGETADELGVATISDLADHTDLTLGAPADCETNAFCLPGLERVYGIDLTANYVALEPAAIAEALEPARSTWPCCSRPTRASPPTTGSSSRTTSRCWRPTTSSRS